MARNKYPEETIRRILDVSLKLFVEKGYEHTTIQDIVDELGDLSKGAVYHHFKSKEAIICAVTDRLFEQRNPFEIVRKMDGLNGLEQLRQLLLETTVKRPEAPLYRDAVSLLKNPKFLVQQLEEIFTITGPMLSEVIEVGVQDGSIQTDYPEELAETLLIMLNIWLSPSFLDLNEEQFMKKVHFLSDILEKMGVPLFMERERESIRSLYRLIHSENVSDTVT